MEKRSVRTFDQYINCIDKVGNALSSVMKSLGTSILLEIGRHDGT